MIPLDGLTSHYKNLSLAQEEGMSYLVQKMTNVTQGFDPKSYITPSKHIDFKIMYFATTY